jgi:predicted Zn-ribbon and HTH transcriptional regulator
MDGRVVGADSVMDNSATELVIVPAICPACGYPTLGADLCAYCRPQLAS